MRKFWTFSEGIKTGSKTIVQSTTRLENRITVMCLVLKELSLVGQEKKITTKTTPNTTTKTQTIRIRMNKKRIRKEKRNKKETKKKRNSVKHA